MSAPKTNLEKQRRRHWPVLIGIAVVLGFAGIVFLLNMDSAVDGDGPIIEELAEETLETEAEAEAETSQ